MKISFNFGTQRNVDPRTLARIINYFIKENTTWKFSNLHAGTGTVYINLYDENGVAQDIVTEEGKHISYIVRGEPYKRTYKNMSGPFTFGYIDKETGEKVTEAYVYEKYEFQS